MTVTVADVLHYAADRLLAVDRDDAKLNEYKHRFSCCAVENAADELGVESVDILEGLWEMGCPTNSGTAFEPFGYGRALTDDIQGARYLWLKLAALIAEEQGV